VQAVVRTAGGSWSAPARLGSGGDVEVALDGTGNAVALWLGTSNVLQSARHRRGATAWSRPFVVARGAAAPEFAMNADGNAVAVWTRRAKGVTMAALRPASLGTWVRYTAVSGPGASAPRVAMSGRGEAVAVWNRTVPPRIAVESRNLVGAWSVLARLSAPKKTVVQRTTRFSVLAGAWASPLAGLPTWRFGDGASATGMRASHAYASAGHYAVTVTARDTAGGVSTLTRTISVAIASSR
jgi:hypothetical protein